MKRIILLSFSVLITISAIFLTTPKFIYANTIDIIIIGDKDGFGIGANPGDGVNFNNLIFPDINHTDMASVFWNGINFVYSYNREYLCNITDATIEIVHAGNAYYGGLAAGGPLWAYSDYYNGYIFVGRMSPSMDPSGRITAVRDVFSFSNTNLSDNLVIEELNNDDNFLLNVCSIASDTVYAVDYVQLTLYGSNSSPTPVPSTLLLLGSGILGLSGWRRFRKG